jgi:hypothetical protein
VQADPEARALFLRVALAAPALLASAEVAYVRFASGAPALILDGEWVVGEDRHGDLMCMSQDGGRAGYCQHGRIQELARLHVRLTFAQ